MSQGAIVNPNRAIPRFRLNNVTPFTYRDGLTFLELVEELREWGTNVFPKEIEGIIGVLVDELAEASEQFEDGVEEFQRIHDAFMADVNLALMALNDNAVSDLANDPDTTLGTTLRELFVNNEQMLEYQDQLDAQFTAFEQNIGDFAVNITLPPYNAVAGEDVTDIANQALADVHGRGGGTVMFPPADQPYYVDAVEGLHILSNTTVDIRGGAVIAASPTDSANYGILKIWDQHNVAITGGGEIRGDRHTHTGTSGEWGFGVEIRGGRNIVVEDVSITQCWGDAVYIGRGYQAPTVTPTNIHVRNTEQDDCRRQGISVIRGTDVFLVDNVITNIEGANPMAGIDVEPNEEDFVRNLTIRGNSIRDAQWGVILQGRYGAVEDVHIVENTAHTIAFSGVRVLYGTRCVVDGNIISHAKLNMVALVASSHNTVVNNIGKNISEQFSANPRRPDAQHAIQLSDREGIGSSHNIIHGNTVLNSGTGGVHISAETAQCLHNIVSGNSIIEANGDGITMLDGAVGTTVTGNTIQGSGMTGVRVHSNDRDNPVEHISIRDNTIEGSNTAGISVTVGNDIFVVGNTVRGGHGSAQILLQVTRRCNVSNNIVRIADGSAATGISASLESLYAFIDGNDAYNGGVDTPLAISARYGHIANNWPDVEA